MRFSLLLRTGESMKSSSCRDRYWVIQLEQCGGGWYYDCHALNLDEDMAIFEHYMLISKRLHAGMEIL
jgi:hypothetical protein